jgi:bromodomain-containing protein 8
MAEDTKYRLKQMPTDVWSIREKLALASSVMRSGDQNWVSVSRAIRPFGNPGRPDDWFSQKNCALQYSALLEKVETPRRKRGERDIADTPGDVIVRKLTVERIEELKRILQEEKAKYRSLKKDLEMVRCGQMDHQIKEMYEKMLADKKAAEEMAAKKAAEEKAARDAAKAAALRLKKPLLIGGQRKPLTSDIEDNTQDSLFNDEDSNQSLASSVPTPAGPSRTVDLPSTGTPTPSSPLLIHLLSNPPKMFDVLSKPTSAASVDVTAGDVIPGFVSTVGTTEEVTIKEELVDMTTLKSEDGVVPSDVQLTTDSANTTKSDDSSQDTETGGGVAVGIVGIGNSQMEEMELKQEQLMSLGSTLVDNVEALVSDVPTAVEFEDVELVSTTTPTTKMTDLTSVDQEHNLSQLLMTDAADNGTSQKTLELRRLSEPEVNDVVEDAVTEKHDDQKTNDTVLPSSVTAQSVTVATDDQTAKGSTLAEESDEFPVSPASSVMSSDAVHYSNKLPSTTGSRSTRGNQSKRLSRRSSHAHQQSTQDLDVKETSESLCLHKPSEELDTSEDDEVSLSTSHLHGDESNTGADLFGPSMRRKIDLSESLPNSPASFTHSDTEDEKAHKIWKKSIMLVWRSIANHKCANIFMHKVNEDIAPGYHSIVHRPMDLTMIKKNIDSGVIRTTAEFQRDMMLMLINAMMYNHVEHDVHKMAVSMYDDVMTHIEHFVNTQMMVQSEPKLLRTLRRSDAHSDKEDEQRKRKTSEPELQPASGGKVKKRR